MCGRYTLITPPEAMRDLFAVEGPLPNLPPRYNLAPTQNAAVLRRDAKDGRRALAMLRWGLVPSWSKEPKSGYSMINARAETVAVKPAFRGLMKSRRCLVPADGFYEWRPAGKRKQPYYITMKNGAAPFAFAGLWDARRVGGERVDSAAIVTTAANAVCAPVHDRMPCVLAGPEEEAAWLSGELDAAALAELLVPLDAGRTAAAPANPAVNRAGVEGPELLTPPGDTGASQLELGV